jgi:hypothetical protein
MSSILQTIGTVFALISSFLGALYWLGGDLILSGFISAVLVIVLYFIVDQLVRRKVEVRKQRFGPVALVLWAGYALVSLPLSLLLLHSLNVEIFHRTEVQQAAAEKIAALNGMTQAYKAQVEAELNTQQTELVRLLLAYVQKKGGTAAADTVLTSPPFSLSPGILANLDPNSAQQDAQLWRSARQAVFDKAQVAATDRAKAYRKDKEQVFTDWHRLKVPLAYAELDTLVATNLSELQASYAVNTATPDTTFNYELPQVPMLMAEPLALWRRTTPYALLLALIAFHALLLLPFLIEKGAGSYIVTRDTLQEHFPEAFEL